LVPFNAIPNGTGTYRYSDRHLHKEKQILINKIFHIHCEKSGEAVAQLAYTPFRYELSNLDTPQQTSCELKEKSFGKC
jgi:thiamine pyrophosphokinase